MIVHYKTNEHCQIVEQQLLFQIRTQIGLKKGHSFNEMPFLVTYSEFYLLM